MGNLGSTLLRDDTKTALRETIFFWHVLEGPVSFFRSEEKNFKDESVRRKKRRRGF